MGPEELAAAARDLAKKHGAKFSVIAGDALLQGELSAGHAVGQGSDRAPRLIDIAWGRADAPKVTLVGKGVCFDTGGYDLKPSSGMLVDEKDMGGAAHRARHRRHGDGREAGFAPARARAGGGEFRFRRAYRPSDVFKSRKGLTVEIGNTDAERTPWCSPTALTEADSEAPELLIDIATAHRGRARGDGLRAAPPFFTDDDACGLRSHAPFESDAGLDVAHAVVARL